jgi:hypothetical protein
MLIHVGYEFGFDAPLPVVMLLKLRQFKNETHQPQELTKKGSSGTV